MAITTDKTVNDPDAYPVDDYYRAMGEILVLNRIDQEWPCKEIVDIAVADYPVYGTCDVPEWEPLSNRCYDHTPGVMHSWDM